MQYDIYSGLVVVDVQNDFAHPEGSLHVQGADRIVERINEEVAAARAKGATVVYTRDWHPPETPHFETRGGRWPPHCVAGTWGAEFHARLTVVDGAVHIKKGLRGDDGYSAFASRMVETDEVLDTGLGVLLWERGVVGIAVVGLALDVCVKATAVDARRHDLVTTVLASATRAVRPEAVDETLALLGRAGVKVE